LWPSYEGANNWKILELVPKKPEDEKGAQESIKCVLNVLVARVTLMMRIGEVGAVGTTDVAAIMGYYLVKWLSEPYTLQVDTEGMAGSIGTGKMVADALYFNKVQRTPYWYTLSVENTIVEVRYVLQTGVQMQEISRVNKLPNACNRMEATRQGALKLRSLDHDAIMEEASRRDWLEYDDDEESEEESNKESEEESDEESK
jgi:hypothetical protein